MSTRAAVFVVCGVEEGSAIGPAFVFVVVSERLWSELTVRGDGKWRDE